MSIDMKVMKHADILKYRYGLDKIIAVAPYGSMNYNLFEENVSDVDTKAIYCPTLEDVLFSPPISKAISIGNGEFCDLKDIRTMIQMWKKQNINFLEILFSDYLWINPKYKNIFSTYFLKIKESIANFDTRYTYHSIIGQGLTHLKKCHKTYSGKIYANSIRMLMYLEKLQQGKTFKERIVLSNNERKQLLTIKHSINFPSSGEYVYERIKTRFKELQEYASEQSKKWETEEKEEQKRISYIMEQGVKELFFENLKGRII